MSEMHGQMDKMSDSYTGKTGSALHRDRHVSVGSNTQDDRIIIWVTQVWTEQKSLEPSEYQTLSGYQMQK